MFINEERQKREYGPACYVIIRNHEQGKRDRHKIVQN